MVGDIETGTAPSSSEEEMKGFISYRTEICLGGLSGLCVIICIICLCIAEDYFLYGVAVITIITLTKKFSVHQPIVCFFHTLNQRASKMKAFETRTTTISSLRPDITSFVRVTCRNILSELCR